MITDKEIVARALQLPALQMAVEQLECSMDNSKNKPKETHMDKLFRMAGIKCISGYLRVGKAFALGAPAEFEGWYDKEDDLLFVRGK